MYPLSIEVDECARVSSIATRGPVAIEELDGAVAGC
jgi:hypothetical protein